MPRSLAKQDPFIASVNFRVLPVNEATLSCISMRNLQICVKNSAHYITCYLHTKIL
jgi:hypothetical protein